MIITTLKPTGRSRRWHLMAPMLIHSTPLQPPLCDSHEAARTIQHSQLNSSWAPLLDDLTLMAKATRLPQAVRLRLQHLSYPTAGSLTLLPQNPPALIKLTPPLETTQAAMSWLTNLSLLLLIYLRFHLLKPSLQSPRLHSLRLRQTLPSLPLLILIG